MLYNEFQGETLSALGFGAMRLPVLDDGSIDQAHLDRMVDAAMAAGVNYFDTAHPYHGGKSEVCLGKSLARYPRESWNLADKFPGHQNVKGVKPVTPEGIFEEQLRRCGVDYFDFYLLHNVNENSLACYYGKPENRFMDYFLEQKAKGRIRHLGFSCHAAPEGLEQFLALYGKDVEFCQIQLNYVDWTLQDAKRKCEILKDAGLPVWVMEPVRGGKLASFDEETEARLRALRPEESIPAWAFRWLRTLPKPTMILSGMSNLAQMEDNLKTFSEHKPLNEEELALLAEIADRLSRRLPLLLRRLPERAGHPHADEHGQRHGRGPELQPGRPLCRAGARKAGRGLHRLRPVQPGLPPEDRRAGADAPSGRADGQPEKLGGDLPRARRGRRKESVK